MTEIKRTVSCLADMSLMVSEVGAFSRIGEFDQKFKFIFGSNVLDLFDLFTLDKPKKPVSKGTFMGLDFIVNLDLGQYEVILSNAT